MARERYTFEGLEPIEKHLRRKAADIGYVVLWDRTDRTSEETLGRFELDLADALPYLEDDEDLLDDGFDEDEDEDHDDADGEAEEEPAPGDGHAHERRALRLLGRVPGPADFAHAAGRWLRDLAARNTLSEPLRRFRMRAYSPKGARVLYTGSFLCRDEDHDDTTHDLALVQPQEVTPRIPAPSFDEIETRAAGRGMKALGDYYAQWGRIVLGSVGQLQGVNNAMMGKLHRQLENSRDQVDQLVAAVLTHRAAEAELAEQRRASDKSEDTRTVLAQQALHQLGEAARAFLAAKGVTPELADAMGAIGQSPDLLAALNDPDVRLLMQDPNNLKVLAGMLKQVGAQARAARQAANDPTTPLANAS